MKKLIILIIVLLFAAPVIAFDFPKMRDPFQQNRLLQQYFQRQGQADMERERQRQAQELKDKERKQQRQIQEIIDNQRRMIDLQEKMERDNIWR